MQGDPAGPKLGQADVKRLGIFTSALGSAGIFLIGVAALLFSVSSTGLLSVAQEPARGRPKLIDDRKPTPAPDFRLIQLGTFRRDQFLVDRTSGRVWQVVCNGKLDKNKMDCDGMFIWDEMFVDGVTPRESSASQVYYADLLERLQKDQPE